MQLFPCNSDISHYKVAEHLLESGVTMVRILRNRPGVELPQFLNTPIVNLNFSYQYGIDDFAVDERGIRASLSFKGVPHFCNIPWDAVCSILSERTEQVFVWINVFNEEEIMQFLPPETREMFEETKDCSLLGEFPELKEFAFEDALKRFKDSNDEDEDEDEDEEDDGPREFKPLHFV
ncbi:MAG: hypothetical protein IJM59_03395 [Proteobacteria bacterium]|nr:hypothetical protein [Pseudomonadota bacterium]